MPDILTPEQRQFLIKQREQLIPEVETLLKDKVRRGIIYEELTNRGVEPIEAGIILDKAQENIKEKERQKWVRYDFISPTLILLGGGLLYVLGRPFYHNPEGVLYISPASFIFYYGGQFLLLFGAILMIVKVVNLFRKPKD